MIRSSNYRSKARGAVDAAQPIRDLDTVRNFLIGVGPIALFDLPWMPLYLAICFAFNIYLGLTAIARRHSHFRTDRPHRGHVARPDSGYGRFWGCAQRVCGSEPDALGGVSCSRNDREDGQRSGRKPTGT